MGKLKNLNELESSNILELLTNNELTIYEDIQGSKIFVNISNDGVIIKSKSVSSEPINMVDLAMQNYYMTAAKFFESLDDRVKKLLNKDWWFCFEYFPDNQPANIEYSKLPKNNLVLTSIYKSNKFDYTIEEIDEYSRLLDVDTLPVIYMGKLDTQTIEAINYFLNTSESDLEHVFGEKNFAYFFYKLLNPQISNSFLMNDDFQKNLEKIVIKVDNKDISFEILNPLYKKISDTSNTEYTEIYSLILLNFLTYCQSINIDKLKLKGYRKDEVYINIISRIFNSYMDSVKDDILNFDFVIPEFFDKEKFKINRELIINKTTRQYIESDPKIEYVFKCILGSFSKIRKKPIGIFTDATITLFNKFVTDIFNKIDFYLGRNTELEISKSGLINFQKFFDIKYDTDGSGDVHIYPDVYQELGIKTNLSSDKDKGKKIKK